MAVEIGGVTVAEGGSVRWRVLLSVIVSGPIYAVYTGAIDGIQLFGGGVRSGIDGVGEFLVDLISGFFLGAAYAMRASWSELLASARGIFGPFTFMVVAGVTAMTIYGFLIGVSRVYGS
jgi:hypothetical protein